MAKKINTSVDVYTKRLMDVKKMLRVISARLFFYDDCLNFDFMQIPRHPKVYPNKILVVISSNRI